jgi:hypothetical protein
MRYPFAFIVAFAVLVASCGPSNVPQRLAEAEQFDFNFVLLQPDQSGKLKLRMNLDTVCRDYLFSEGELADALRTKQFQVNNVAFTLRLDAIAPCQSVGEVKFQTPQLSQPFTDANGNPGRQRPHSGLLADVVTELSNGGVMEVAVFGVKVNGTTTSRTMTPGAIDLTSAEVPSGQVGGMSGLFSHANLNPTYAEAQLTNVLANPSRFTAEFSFLAKTDPASPEVLLVWDGDMVLRLDVEN